MSRLDRTLLAATVLLVGCAPSTVVRPEVLRSWVGRPAAALEQAWGPATREGTDGGQRVLIYDQFNRRDSVNVGDAGSMERRRTAEPTYVQGAPGGTVGPRAVYAREYLFWLDGAGTIVRVDVREP